MTNSYTKRPKTRGSKVFEFKTDKMLIEGFYELSHDAGGHYPYQVLYTDLTKAEGEPRYELAEANNECIWETAANIMDNEIRTINAACLHAWREKRAAYIAELNAKGKRRRKVA